MKKMTSFALALMIILSLFTVLCHAETGYEYTEDDYQPDYRVYDNIPLLVVVVSFDANGNGIDDFKAGKNCMDSSLDCFGEQWAYSKESYWENEIFGETGKTLVNYFKYNSNDTFTFVPAEETYGTENNGIVYATVNVMHPHAREGTVYSVYGNERHFALAAASEYVDFASFDKNEDGNIDFTELSISFIIAGYNVKFTAAGTKNQYFGLNNFEVSTSGWYAQVDGVKLLNGNSGGRFTYNGEFAGENQPIAFGTIAHELGHVLGAPDLYTYSGYTWCGGPGDCALQGGGSYLSYYGEEQGKSPSAIDPYHMIQFGFRDYEVVNDGEYVLYSKESKLGEYNILRVNTTSPFEYYLIENRFYNGTDTYDAIDGNAKGIMIWHVDELIMRSYTLPNCYKNTAKHAPGLTPLYPNLETGGSNYNAWDMSDGVFDSSRYKFMIVDSPYTTMTVEEANEAGFGFTLEVVSKTATETKVKISGTIETAAEYRLSCANDQLDSILINGYITQMNKSVITNIKCEISKNSNFSEINETIFTEPDTFGQFAFDFRNLDQKSTYYYRVTVYTSHGDRVTKGRAYTVSPPNQNKDSYTAFMYKYLTDANRPFEVKVKIGEKLKYSFPMNKIGYVLAGWYTDSDFTNLYDLNTIRESNENLYLYAKWIEADKATEVNFINGEKTTYYYEVGERIVEPIIEAREGYVFEGWYTDEALTEKYNFDDQIDTIGVINLYAKFTAEEPVETKEPEVTEAPETTESSSETVTEKAPETTDDKQTGNKPLHPTLLFTIIIVSVIAVLLVLLIVAKKIKNNKK